MRTTGLFLWPVQAVGIDDFVFPITISFSTTVLLKAPTTRHTKHVALDTISLDDEKQQVTGTFFH